MPLDDRQPFLKTTFHGIRIHRIKPTLGLFDRLNIIWKRTREES
jgi:hypothetical protein